MMRSLKPVLLLGGALAVIISSGCSQKTEQGLSPEDKKRFGYAGMPMPPEVKKRLEAQKASTGQPPAVKTQ